MDNTRTVAVLTVLVLLLLTASPSHGQTTINLGSSTTSSAAAGTSATISTAPASSAVATATTSNAASANTTAAFKWPTLPKLIFNFTKVNETKINFTLPKLTNITFASTNKTVYLSSDPKNALNITALVAVAQGVVGELMAQLVTAQPLLKVLAPFLAGENTTALNPVALLQQVQQQAAQQSTKTINLFSGPFTVSADGQLQAQVGVNLFTGPLNASSTFTSRHLLANATHATNNQKIAARINTVMSDAWLIAFTGFRLASACLQLLMSLVKSFASGTVVVDAALVVQITELATNLNSAISYLLYAVFKENADSIAPLGLIK